VATALKELVALMERQMRRKLKTLRTDNGTEFVNSEIEQLCKQNGITHQTTTPYTPEQNGIAERAIAIYFDMVCCMLHSSGMDVCYWGEAFMYAVHIWNITPTAALNRVPEHAWTGCKPDISHLRVFGSIAYVNIPKKLCGRKLEPTAVKCRLLGW
jgi:transposase InsO family protein